MCLATGWAATALLAHSACGQIVQPKRGFAGGTDYSSMQATGASWYYNWGSAPNDIGNYNANFYPMFWSGPSQATINSVLAQNPKYILGFNEPENASQSNMSVATAIADWTTISADTVAYNAANNTSIQLISPAVADDSSGQSWIASFMSQAKADGLKVDAIAFHWYDDDTTNGSQAAADFESAVQRYHNEFGLPVFITEFADHDWGGTYSVASMIAANTQMLSIVIPWLNSQSYVAGYANYQWFANNETALYTGTPPLPTTLGYPYDGSVQTGTTSDIGGTNLGEHVAFLTGGTLTMNSSGGVVQYINALAGSSTITGLVNWGLNSASSSNWVQIQPGATLIKSGTNTITFQNGTTTNNGLLQVSAGVLQCSTPISGSGQLSINGTGTAILSATNTYTGGTSIYSGTLQAASDAAIPGSGPSVWLYPAGVFAGAFAVDQAFLGKIANPTSTYGAIALAANDSSSLNFSSSSLSNASLGAVGTQTYSGTLTPNGNTYRLGGGGGKLIFSGTLTGASNTMQINPNVASSTTVSLTGTGNTLGGTVTVNSGTLKLDYTGTTTGAAPILNNNALSMAGATLSVLGTNTASNTTTQSFASLALTAGGNSVVNSVGAAGLSSTLNLGAITRSAGATVDFTLPAIGSITTTTANSNGILGGYATVGGSTWAVSAGTGTAAGAISGLQAASYTTTASAGTTAASYTNHNIDVTSSVAPAAAIAPNSLRFNTAAADTLTLTGTNAFSSGGILVTSAVGNNLSTITGGAIASGNAQGDVIITNNDPSNQLTIASVISAKVTKSGPGTVALTGALSGGPYYANGGTLNLAAGTLGYTLAQANNGGTLILGALTNSVYCNLTANSGGTIIDNGNTFSNTLNFDGGTMTGTGFWNQQSQNSGDTWTAGAGTSSVLSQATVYLNTTTPIVLNTGSVLTITSTLDNAGFTASGSGTLILAGASNYTGATTIGGSTVVQAGSPDTGKTGPLGNSSSGAQILLTGGTLQWSPANNYDYSSRFNTAAGKTYNFDTNGQNVNFAAPLTSPGAPLNKLGIGTLTINGANTLTGLTTIKGGTLALGATGTLANTSGVTIAAGATFDISAATTPFALSSSSATLGGSGTVNGSYSHTIGVLSPGGTGTVGTLSFNNDLNLAGGTLALDLGASNNTPGGTANDLISVGGNLNFSSATLLTAGFSGGTPALGSVYDVINFTGNFIGSTSNLMSPGPTLHVVQNGQQIDLVVTRSAPANLFWNASSSNNWDITTSQNWLNTGTNQPDVFVQNDNVNFNDGGGVVTNINLTTALPAGAITVSSNTNNFTFGGSGSIVGSASLTKTGTSTLTLNTSNSFSGLANAAGGTIIVNGTTGLGTGPLTIGPSGTVQVNGSGTLGNSSCVVNGNLTYNLSTGLTFNNGFNGSGAVNLVGTGSYTFNGAGAFNGSINALSSTTIVPGYVANALSNATINLSGGKLYDVCGFNLTNPLILGGGNGVTSLEVGGSRVDPFSGPMTISANTQFSVDGGSTLILNGNVTGNNFSVSTAGSTGNPLYIGGSWNLGTGTLTTGDQIYFTPAVGQTITISSNLVSSSSLFQNVSSGTTVLKGTNSFAGSVHVEGGVLQVSKIADSGPSNLGNSGTLYLYGGGTLEVTGGTSTTARQVDVLGTGIAGIQVDPGASLAFAGNFQWYGSGSNSFNVSGGGTFSLTANYGGPWNTLNAVTGSGTTVLLGGPVNQINDIATGATVKFNASVSETFVTGQGVGINSGGTLDLNGFSQSIAALNSTNASALVTNSGASPVTITLGNPTNNLSSSYAGNISNGTKTLALTVAGSGTVTLSGNNNYNGGTNVSAGMLVLASADAFPSGTANAGTGLIIGSGATVQIANHGSAATIAPYVSSLTNNGTIDLTNNALVLKGASASLKTITNEVAAAYNSGAWNGSSGSIGVITSSMAASNTTHLTAVGVATGLTSFEGATVSAADVLLKYTYYGDTNLDGKVDASDYSRIDSGYLNHLTGWTNGDFNYDGTINGSDYTLIDNVFNTQGAQLTAEIASPTAQISAGPSAVPEPSSIALIVAGTAILLGRRKRRWG